MRLEHGLVFGMAGALTALWVLGERGVRNAEMAVGGPVGDIEGGGTIVITLIVLFVVLNAVFVAAETAINLLRPIHVKHVKEGNEKRSGRLQDLVDGKAKYATACALGSRAAWLGLGLLVLLLALSYGIANKGGVQTFDIGRFFFHLLLVALPVTLVNLVFGDLVPKSYASLHPHGAGLRLYGFIRVATAIFSIPASLLVAIANLVTRLFGGRASFTLPNETEEQIKNLVDSAQEAGEIEVDEKELLHSVFEFTDTVAREVMTPRVDMDAMPVNSDPDEIVRVMRESGHTRIPLYEETDDQIVGIIHAKDLLMALVEQGAEVSVRSLMRPAQFVPEGKNLHELLTEMRMSRSHIAVVQDEYGGTAGVVTIEDIVEQLVGDIVDEYDVEEPDVVPSGDHGYLVDGKAHLDDVNREIGSSFTTDEFDTIGGYVFGLFGRQPKLGESIDADGYRFIVAETDGRRVQRLQIEQIVAGNEAAIESGT
ncbi:MAG: hemolysin family protein [Fimbriimonas sp.]